MGYCGCCLIHFYILAPNNLTKNNSEWMRKQNWNYGQVMRIIEWTDFECVSYVIRSLLKPFSGKSMANLTNKNGIEVKPFHIMFKLDAGKCKCVLNAKWRRDVALLCEKWNRAIIILLNEMGCNYRVAEESNKHAIESAHHNFLDSVRDAAPKISICSQSRLTDVLSRRKWLHIAWPNDRNYCLSYVLLFMPIVDCNLVRSFRSVLVKVKIIVFRQMRYSLL